MVSLALAVVYDSFEGFIFFALGFYFILAPSKGRHAVSSKK
jgi:hypothetical protein